MRLTYVRSLLAVFACERGVVTAGERDRLIAVERYVELVEARAREASHG